MDVDSIITYSALPGHISSTDEWTNKMCYMHITEYYIIIKRKEGLVYDTTWMIFMIVLCVSLTGSQVPGYMARHYFHESVRVFPGGISIWIVDSKKTVKDRLSFSAWVHIVQSTEGLTRIKKAQEGRLCFSAWLGENGSIRLPLDLDENCTTAFPGSQVFGFRLNYPHWLSGSPFCR